MLGSSFDWLAAENVSHEVLSLQCSFLKLAVASLRLSPASLFISSWTAPNTPIYKSQTSFQTLCLLLVRTRPQDLIYLTVSNGYIAVSAAGRPEASVTTPNSD